MTLLINIREIFLASILMVKKHQVNLKQTQITEKRFIVLNHPIQREVNEDLYIFCYLTSMMKVTFVLIARRAFFDVLEGVDSNNCRSLRSRVLKSSLLPRE